MKEVLVDLRQALRETQKYELRTKNAEGLRRRPVVLAAAGLVVAGWLAWIGWSWLQSSVQHELPQPPGATSTQAVPVAHTLTYWLTVQTVKDGVVLAEVESTGTETFRRDSRFRFNFSNPQAGFVYVLNESRGVAGEPLMTLLYPTPSISAGSAEVPVRGVASTGSFYFDPKAAVERVWIVWSPQPQPQLEQAKRWVNAEHQGLIKDGVQAAVIQGLLMSSAAKGTATRVDEGAKRTIVTGGDLLVHKVELRTR
jgi:hypothetical protein